MNILVIGSSGFIGKTCVEFFRAAGHHVSGADVVPKDNNDFSFYQIDSFAPDFNTVFSKTQFDLCINASGAASIAFSLQNPAEDYRLNVTNVELMLNAIVKHQHDCRFINFSSAAVYGNPDQLPIAENASLKPVSPYGKNKLEAEKVLRIFHERTGIKTCSLRVFSAYGPELHKQLFWDIYQKSLLSKNITLFGTGNETRDFIFIDDLVRAIETVSKESKMEGEAINVASGKEISIREVAEKFVAYIGNDFSLQFSGEEKAGDPKNWRADVTLLHNMGFVSSVSIEEGLQKVVQSYLSLGA